MSEPIRIINIVNQMNSGGLENRLMDIYRNIDKEKIQFDFYTNRTIPGTFDEEIIRMGGKVYYSNPFSLSNPRKKMSEFDSFLKDHHEYKIIHAHLNELSTLFCKVAMKNGVPVRIAHSRATNAKVSLKILLYNLIRLPIKRYATHYFAVSKEAGMHLFGTSAVINGLVKILPNAIDTKKFSFSQVIREEKREELGLNDEFAIIHVGNLLPVKNHLFLLAVFNEYRKINDKAVLILVGDGPQRSAINSWLEENNMSGSVSILGKRSDVNELLQAADFFVFPSFHEGFPGAVLEAQTAGLPCLISDTITKEVMITDGVKSMSLSSSPKLWAELIENGRHKTANRKDRVNEIRAAGYDIHDLVNELQNIYLNAIK